MSSQVVGLLVLTFIALVKTTYGQAPGQNSFFGQGGMLDHECYERPYQTSCVGPIPRYFYNATNKICEQINNVCGYGGFFSLQECDNKCTCRLPPDAGTNTCHGAIESQRYFFNQNGDLCLPFTYYGCEGNGNNFATAMECTMHCNAPREIEQGDVMRSMGFTNERAFEAQAGLYSYVAPPPPPPPPKTRPPTPPSSKQPPSHPPPPPNPHHSRPFPPPPRHPPLPPNGGHYTPPYPWNNHATTPYRPRWQPPPPPPNSRPSYMPNMRSPRPPPNGQPPFGKHPMSRQMIPTPTSRGNNNRMGKENRNVIQRSFGKTSFSMNNVQDNPKQVGRQGPRNGMSWNRPNKGQTNQMQRKMGGQVTIQPTPIVSMAQSTMMPLRNNWRGNTNQGHQGPPPNQRKPGNKKPSKPTKTDKGITSGSLNQPEVKIVKVTTTQSSIGFNNRGTTDYYYYDNAGYTQGTTAGYYNNINSGWGNTRRGMGK